MALELNDLMALKQMSGSESGFTPYEQVKVGHMQSKRPSGVAIAGLTVGVAGTVAAIAAGAWAGAKAKEAKEVAAAKNDGLKELVQTLASTLVAERQERINGDITLNATINDTVSGSQQGTLTASQIAQQEATQSVMTGLMTGRYSENPLKVVRVSGQRECPCDSGCGCMG